MRIFYSGLPQNLEKAPEALIAEHSPDVMLSFLDFYKKEKIKPPHRFLKHLQNIKTQSNAQSRKPRRAAGAA